MSLPVVEERPASSWYTSDSDSIDLAARIQQEATRPVQSRGVRNVPSQRNGVPVEAESTAKSKVKRHYMKEWKGNEHRHNYFRLLLTFEQRIVATRSEA